MVIDKRLGVAASVVLTEALADLVDDEIRRLHLPSRSSMIRLCIEEYFAPTAERGDSESEQLKEQIAYLEARLADKDIAINALQDNVDIMKGVFYSTRMIEAPKTKKWYEFWKFRRR